MKTVEEYPPDRRSVKAAIEDNIGSCIIALLSLLALISALCWPFIKMNKVFSEHLIDMTSFNDYLVVNVFVFASYTLQYLLTAGILESTNPRGFKSELLNEKQLQQRKSQIRKEIILGIGAMFGMSIPIKFELTNLSLISCQVIPHTLSRGCTSSNHIYGQQIILFIVNIHSFGLFSIFLSMVLSLIRGSIGHIVLYMNHNIFGIKFIRHIMHLKIHQLFVKMLFTH